MIDGSAPGTRRLYADHREIDIGCRSDRQEVIGDDAEKKQSDRQQRGADRPHDEWR
jgi:hypothetical protein